jgi:hypothetical protein
MTSMIKIIKAIFFAVASTSFFICALFLVICKIFPEYTIGREVESINIPQLENIASIKIRNNISSLSEEYTFSRREDLIELVSLFENNSKYWLIYCYGTAPSYEYTIRFNLKDNNYVLFYSDLDEMIAISGDEDQCLKTKKISPEEMSKIRQSIKK